MPRRSTTWYCDKCSKPYRSFSAAEKCELNHIVQDSTDGFGFDLDKIMEPRGVSPKERMR